MASRSNLKLRSPSRDHPAKFNLKPWRNGEQSGQSPVSWKVLRKQYPWLKQLYPHQRKGVEATLSTDGFAALFAQRTGKTWVTGAVLTAERDVSLDVLLVGPLTNLESTWGKFLREKLPWYSVHRSLEAYDKHQKEFVKTQGHRDHCVLLLNPEQLTKIRSKLRRRKWDRFIWDEAQRLKSRSSQSSRDAALIGKSAKRRLALTGTPMDLDPKDLWAIMRFVEPSLLGDSWKEFEEEYLEKPKIDLNKKMGVMQRKKMILAYSIAKRKAPVRADKLDDLADVLSNNIMRISKEDAGIESAKVKIIRFDLDPQEERKYRQLEKHMVVKHRGVTVKTPLKITQIGKLQQMTGGHIKDELGEVHVVGTSKRRQLRKAIKHLIPKGKPFVVFCKYVWEVHLIERMLGRMGYPRVAKLWGKVKDLKKDPRRTDMLLGFQRGEYDAMVCQQRTGGVGVDLYHARWFIVYSMGHSFIDYDQMISRGDFLEQDEPANFFILAVRSSIDTDIISAVRRKKSITEQFYDRVQRGTRK